MQAFDIRMAATEEYQSGMSPTETLMFDAGARWCAKQLRLELEHFVKQIKEAEGFYRWELDSLPTLCDIEEK